YCVVASVRGGPGAALFPYTTLFRSCAAVSAQGGHPRGQGHARSRRPPPARRSIRGATCWVPRADPSASYVCYRRSEMHRLVPLLRAMVVVACASDAGVPAERWTGTMDTLPPGESAVRLRGDAVGLSASL